MDSGQQYTLAGLAQLLDLEIQCSGNIGHSEHIENAIVKGIATLSGADQNHLSFYSNSRYHQDLLDTRAVAVIIEKKYAQLCPVPALISDNPYVTFAKATRLFAAPTQANGTIHPTAIIDPSASLGTNVTIGQNCVIGANTKLGDNVQIAANCVIENDCSIGDSAFLHPNVTLYSRVHIGRNAEIHSSVVIGSDGFGYASDGKQYHKIAQLGGVLIGDNVDIGAGSCIDRGAIDDTVIGDGVKIDNLVQIAHNVTIGDHSVLCGCSAVAGSSEIGRYCTLAGGVGVINHVKIADGTTITAMSLVNQSVDEAGFYSSGTGLSPTGEWKRSIVRFRDLDAMARRISRLEKALEGKKDDK